MFPHGPSEICVSQLRVIQLLQKLGFQYLSPEEVAVERDGDVRSVLLKRILADQLNQINRIDSRGEGRVISGAGVAGAIAMLNRAADSGASLGQERVYRLLLGGGRFEQSAAADLNGESFKFIDWYHPLNNAFHVTADYCVCVGGGCPDRFLHVVCFVNGIPFVTIEWLMKGGLERFQGLDARFSTFCQIFIGLDGKEKGHLLAGPGNDCLKGWTEVGDDKMALTDLIKMPFEVADHHQLFFRRDVDLKAEFERGSERRVTGQDRIIWNLCRLRYLLDYVRHFVCFDDGGSIKKVALHSQYRVVLKLRDRIVQRGKGRRRKGGLIWYAESAGKSEVILFLSKMLAFDSDLRGCRILFVSDRTDLLDWIESNLLSSDVESLRASSRNDLNGEKRLRAFTMRFAAFEAGLGFEKSDRECGNGLIVLMDKGQREWGSDSIRRMKVMLPNACFLVFSGSPPTKSEKRLASAYGGYVKSRYTYRDALSDRAIVPLYYDNRSQVVSRSGCRKTLVRGLSSELKALGSLRSEGRSEAKNIESWYLFVACDLSDHFSKLWRGSGSRGIAVVSSESDGILLKSFLDRVGKVRSEISLGSESGAQGLDSIGSPLAGNDLLERMKVGIETAGKPSELDMRPDILIVHQKMLPLTVMTRDCLLYIIRWPIEDEFLQTIASMNRRCEGKDFALMVDYSSRSARSEGVPILAALEVSFDRADLNDSLIEIDSVVRSLRDRLESIWKLLSLKGSEPDDESLELALADASIREGFHEAFFEFHRILLLAHSSSQWIGDTPKEVVHDYHQALVFFQSLRLNIANRYALDLDHTVFEAALKKLIDVAQSEIELPVVLSPDECLEGDVFDVHLNRMATTRAKADMIAYQNLRMISKKADSDPFYYREFIDGFHQAIEARRCEQVDDVQYLKLVSHYLDEIRQGRQLVQSESRQTSEFISALVEVSRRTIGANLVDAVGNSEWRFSETTVRYEGSHPSHKPWDLWNIQVATQVLKLIRLHCRVGWRDSVDIQNRMRNDIDDYLFELQERGDMKLSIGVMDEFIEASLAILKAVED